MTSPAVVRGRGTCECAVFVVSVRPSRLGDAVSMKPPIDRLERSGQASETAENCQRSPWRFVGFAADFKYYLIGVVCGLLARIARERSQRPSFVHKNKPSYM